MALGIVKYFYDPLISQLGSVGLRSVVMDPLSASLDGLQSIVNACSKLALENDLVSNGEKTFWCSVFVRQISIIWLSDS